MGRKLYLKVGKRSIYVLLTSVLAVVIINLFIFSQSESKEDKNFQTEFAQNYSIYALTLPEELNFASEKIPVYNVDVMESLDREFLVNTYWQSQTLLFYKRINKYFPVIEPILKRNNIPEDFKYLALAESGLANVTSPSGAKGFWQFLEGTAKDFGLEVNDEIDERYHLEKATEAACKYFQKSYAKYKNWTLVAASYNMGMNGLDKQIKRQKVHNYYDLLLNEETSRYVFRIVALKTIMSHPEKYGFNFRRKDLYQTIATNDVRVDSAITDFADFAAHFSTKYKVLKLLNPWLRQNYLTNKQSKEYFIQVPKNGARDINFSRGGFSN